MRIVAEKLFVHFITKMNLFCGGKFLRRSLLRGPLEAYIFIFLKSWKQPILRTSHPGCHSIKPVNWTAILAVTQSTGLGGRQPPQEGSDGGDGFPTTLDIWRSPGPTSPGTKYPVRGIPHFDLLPFLFRRDMSHGRDVCCSKVGAFFLEHI